MKEKGPVKKVSACGCVINNCAFLQLVVDELIKSCLLLMYLQLPLRKRDRYWMINS